MKTNNTAEKCNNYHHGNLRDALIIAAAELIEQNGSMDFAMIDAARRAGVSSAAPYRHFKDKESLLEAVCQVAFMALSESAETTTAPYPLGSSERIIALGKGYLKFVTSHPEFYDLMWGKSGIRAMDSAEIELKVTGFHLLAEAVESWCQATGTQGNDPVDLATKLWAMAHGLSSLALNGHVNKFMPDVDVYSLIESSTHTFLGGLEKSR
jgi:AcrR family transcriptional regulator